MLRLILLLTIIFACSIYAQDDSTQVQVLTPPENQVTNPLDTAPQIYNNNNQLWLKQHNQDLLAILDTLIVSMYKKSDAKLLLIRIRQPDSSDQKTADFRTRAISDFLNTYIKKYGNGPYR